MQLNFDATNVAPAAAPVPLETGWYPANILSTEEKPTKTGQGAYLEIKFRLSTGPSTGKVLTSRLNLKNVSAQAVEIAYAELSAICHAVGKLRVAVASELHGGPLEIYVKKVPRTDAAGIGQFSNDIGGYRAIGAAGSQPGFTGAVATQVTAAPAWATPAAPAVVQAQPAQPAQQAWGAPAPAQPQYAPQPAQTAPAAPAGAVPPWAR